MFHVCSASQILDVTTFFKVLKFTPEFSLEGLVSLRTSNLNNQKIRYSLTVFLGQSLSEYSLCLGLLAMVCIASLASLGGQIQNTMSNALQPQGAPQQLSALTQPNAMPLLGPPNLQQGLVPGNFSKLAAAPAGTQAVCLDGYCFHLPLVDGLSDAIDLTGTNGTEKINAFVKVLEQIASQMEQDPNADPGLSARIKDLALAGHDLGFHQGQMGTRKSMNTPQHMAMSDQYRILQDAFTKQRQNLNAYLTEHPQSTTNSIKDLLHQQSEQIVRVGVDVNIGVGGKASFSFNMKAKSKLTHQSANSICQSGANGCYVPPETTNHSSSNHSSSENESIPKS
jgi:hypothetical protein